MRKKQPKFQRRHYIMIAEVLRATFDPTISDAIPRQRQLMAIVDAMSIMFKMDNPDFDADRFARVVMRFEQSL